MKNHRRTHTGEMYKCSVCDKQFACSTDLKYHMVTHTGKTPYKCSLCDKNVMAKRRLTLHMYTHTGEKIYKCDVCHTGFSQCGSLTRHKLTHTGENHMLVLCVIRDLQAYEH